MSLNGYQDRNKSAWQILEHLKRNESSTIKDLEELLGVTTTAVRQQLNVLLADGYIERKQVHAGVGRPHHAYSITGKAHELFACHCDDLALTLLEEVLELDGGAMAALLLDRVGNRLAAKYAKSVRSEILVERVEQLATALHDRGVLTEVEPKDDDTIILRAYNCPYHELAQEHRSICEMDEKLIRTVLGSDVNLSDCMMDGHAGCSFVVSRAAG